MCRNIYQCIVQVCIRIDHYFFWAGGDFAVEYGVNGNLDVGVGCPEVVDVDGCQPVALYRNVERV